MFLAKWLRSTSIVPAGIMLPPLAPTAAFSFPSCHRHSTKTIRTFSLVRRFTRRSSHLPLRPTNLTLRTMVGHMEERGRFRGATKLLGAGGGVFAVVFAGMEKSSISLLSTMPVDGERTCAPK